MERPEHPLRWLFDSWYGPSNYLIARWIFLRALGAIYFSAFFSLLFQIRGLIGPQGILPAQEYLSAVQRSLGGGMRFWFAPTLFWLSTSSHMMMTVTWIGLLASVLAVLNIWPRLNLFLCLVCFLSFVSAAGDFSGYQSDGMLLEAGFISLFFAPSGLLPGLGAAHPPPRASLFLLLWEWFRIYFESGLVKVLSGDPQWRNLTAMDDYYQNSPLPTWIGWYAGHLPHWFHEASTVATLVLEFVLVFLLFFPRRARIICFLIVTPWEIGVILTGNYAFLNYLVLSLGILLLDDGVLNRFVPARWRSASLAEAAGGGSAAATPAATLARRSELTAGLHGVAVASCGIMLSWIAYVTTAELIAMPLRHMPLPSAPIAALEPFRIANQYGLFAVMTRGRYEIEFQGSNDNENWTPYPFQNKPQALNERPRIYAPYQPRFDWNLWFASLGEWRQNQIVPITQERLLENDSDVLSLFRDNPFPQAPPRYVRAVLWQYWFSSWEEKHRTGNWWRRQLLGPYSPTITRTADGKFGALEWPGELPRHD